MKCDDCGKEFEELNILPCLNDNNIPYQFCDECLEKLTDFIEEELNND